MFTDFVVPLVCIAGGVGFGILFRSDISDLLKENASLKRANKILKADAQRWKEEYDYLAQKVAEKV